MFSYRPIRETEDELQGYGLLPDGIYDAEITQFEDGKISKNGNPMAAIVLKVYDHKAMGKIIFDYLIDIDSMRWKLLHFIEALELDKDSGCVKGDDVIGKSFKVEITTQNDKTGKYKPKNVIKDYIKTEDFVKEASKRKDDDIKYDALDDDIQF